jgi:hypothetical protein
MFTNPFASVVPRHELVAFTMANYFGNIDHLNNNTNVTLVITTGSYFCLAIVYP